MYKNKNLYVLQPHNEGPQRVFKWIVDYVVYMQSVFVDKNSLDERASSLSKKLF
jgi:hypothetical protein